MPEYYRINYNHNLQHIKPRETYAIDKYIRSTKNCKNSNYNETTRDML